MILRPFLSNRPFTLALLIPVIAGFCLLNGYFGYHELFPKINIGLWGETGLLSEWWISIVSGFIIGLNALQLNVLFNRHEFLERNNYGPALFYVLLMSFSHSFYQVEGLLLAHVCWLQAIRLMFRIRPNEDARKHVFNAAFFVGLSATFHPASAGLLIFFWFALWALKQLTFREFLLSFTGFLVPVANALVYWWFSGHRLDTSLLWNSVIVPNEKVVYYATSGLIAGLFVLSMIGIQIRLQKSSIRFKKLTRSLIWILAGCVLLGTAHPVFYQQMEWFSLMFIPLSFFLTFAFIHRFWEAVSTFFFYAAFLLAVVKFFIDTLLLI